MADHSQLSDLLSMWERHFGELGSASLKERFLKHRYAGPLARMDPTTLEYAVPEYGPKLKDIFRGIRRDIRQTRVPASSHLGQASPIDAVGTPLKEQDWYLALKVEVRWPGFSERSFDGEDFLECWVDRWEIRPDWTDEELDQIFLICLEHDPGHIKSSIKSVRPVASIAARCADLAAGRNPRNETFAAENVYQRSTVYRPPKSSGLGPTQNYRDDT